MSLAWQGSRAEHPPFENASPSRLCGPNMGARLKETVSEEPRRADESAHQPREATGERAVMNQEISRTMVGLYKEQFGRGPVKSRSDWAGEDTLICTLEDSLTPAERNMVKMGEHQRLRDVRMFFQYATLRDFIEPVERITGRTVRSFISGIDTHEDVSTELFYFYPRGSEGPSRAEKSDV
jgi:uncharacterized protein YbcI